MHAPCQVEEVSEGLLYGRPHLLVPDGDMLSDFEAADANEEALTALCQACVPAADWISMLPACHIP